eukprot:CAMPEP_0201550004 /NCGR_PEP_ID=MMETSP0173_2-20130828/6429_1 /ASSEMBLY_ACC=CAM_ASM_000268 /TAXON_ID=218659 /ORGANISM="Vexillifera sp., Strain DIVA3 564/2" /LENGTH=169 /DNA_ID=CAMNT_0047959873 /DNA_START=103 /DNA_END=612 /DNA_ORIENTATION=+
MSADINASDSNITATWDKITSENDDTNWMLLSPKSGSKSDLEVVGSGSGGLNEMKETLDEGRIMFGLLKVVGVDEKETTTSRRAKYVFITFIGSKVSVLVKARVSIQKGQVTPLFHGVQIFVDISGVDELEPKVIADKLIASGGAHKPSHYEFGPGQKYDADFYHTGTG